VSDLDAELPDNELAVQCRVRRHDPRPFEILVRRHQGFVVANCRMISRSATDAEDLAQDVFVKAYFALPRYEPRAPFLGWLKTIKVNHCLNHLRKQRRATFVDVDGDVVSDVEALSTEPEVDRIVEAEDARERVVRVLDRLSDTVRVPLVLCDADGLSYEEIAAQLGIGLSAVKMRIKRGREEFRRLYALEEGATTAGIAGAA
jgi:RNA polymerase sigma-70 factor, ECF subfamily